LSKGEVIEDLLGCIADALSKPDCDFNDTGAWQGYSARIKVELTLRDIDNTTVEKLVQVGEVVESTITKTVEVPVASPDVIRERINAPLPSLELGAPEQTRRWYAPRQAKRKGM
jgi:hypothetical protein